MSTGIFRVAQIGALAAAVAVTGCSDLSQAIGLSRRTPPDEFQVVTHAPLSLPPEFALRPPAPGETGPGTTTPQAQARAAVTGSTGAPTGSTTQGENALLATAGAIGVDPSIRLTIDAESRIESESTGSGLADFLLFWRETPPAGVIVDAAGEAQRIRENQAAGRPITAGETPVIERTSGGIRLF
ncbi:MAG: DUF3035 domain-containing protein [Alphaproteobacteria bacterium]